MKKLFLLCATITLNAFDNFAPLTSRLHPVNMRFSTFYLVLHMMHERNAKVLVETGCMRLQGKIAYTGDGGSTIIFGHWAQLHNAQLYTVDISDNNIHNAQELTKSYHENIHFFVSDSVQFLASFDKQIDFLYLDSFDFEENNPLPSQEHHLKEIQAAYDKLSPHAIIMIDDCALPHGGKGKLAIQFLLSKGWRIIAKHYQVVLIR